MKEETARREIESLDCYLQNHTNDYSEESHMAMMMAIKALEQQPCEKCEVGNPCLYCEYDFTEKKTKEPCDDCISLNKLDDIITKAIDDSENQTECQTLRWVLDVMSELPSVTPTKPKGKWIQTKDECDGVNFYDFSFECTKCGKERSFKSNYCPNCGAYMRESGDVK